MDRTTKFRIRLLLSPIPRPCIDHCDRGGRKPPSTEFAPGDERHRASIWRRDDAWSECVRGRCQASRIRLTFPNQVFPRRACSRTPGRVAGGATFRKRPRLHARCRRISSRPRAARRSSLPRCSLRRPACGRRVIGRTRTFPRTAQGRGRSALRVVDGFALAFRRSRSRDRRCARDSFSDPRTAARSRPQSDTRFGNAGTQGE